MHKLTRAGKFEHSPTAVENLQKGFPKDMIKELKKEDILIVKPTNYGEPVSINLSQKEKVMD